MVNCKRIGCHLTGFINHNLFHLLIYFILNKSIIFFPNSKRIPAARSEPNPFANISIIENDLPGTKYCPPSIMIPYKKLTRNELRIAFLPFQYAKLITNINMKYAITWPTLSLKSINSTDGLRLKYAIPISTIRVVSFSSNLMLTIWFFSRKASYSQSLIICLYDSRGENTVSEGEQQNVNSLIEFFKRYYLFPTDTI